LASAPPKVKKVCFIPPITLETKKTKEETQILKMEYKKVSNSDKNGELTSLLNIKVASLISTTTKEIKIISN
jgi:hypothetical protein